MATTPLRRRIAYAGIALLLSTGLCEAASNSEADDPVSDVAQKEIDRIKGINPELLVLRPVTVACVTVEELRDWIMASIAKGNSADVEGCYPIQKAVKVRVLDYPNVLTAHVKFVLPAGASSLVQGTELYTLPAQVVDRNTVPKSLFLDTLPPKIGAGPGHLSAEINPRHKAVKQFDSGR